MAEVKLETFPYTKYGTVQAKVDVVTADAVTDEKRGSYYPATLTLSQKDMLIDGKRVDFEPRHEHHGGNQDGAAADY